MATTLMPAERSTRLVDAVDLDREGRTIGYLGLVHSTTPSLDYAIVPVPVAVLANGAGPTVLLTAGTHGDEYEGQVLLQDFARSLDLAQVRGRLILLPALNLPAVRGASRTSPLDDGNLNRCYPGDRDGTPTYALADYVTRFLLPKCDYAVDLHSGGRATEYLPSGFITRFANGRHTARQVEAMRAFGLPYTMVFDERAEDRALDSACEAADVVMVSTELSGSGMLNPGTLADARVGLRRLLEHWGVLADSPVAPSPGTRFIDINDPRSSIMAPAAGLFEPVAQLGSTVCEGDLAGWIYPVEDLAAPRIPLHIGMDGVVIKRRTPPLVDRGAYVMSVGTPVGLEGV